MSDLRELDQEGSRYHSKHPRQCRALEDANHHADGYNPLGEQRLDGEWIRRLSQSGKDCFDAIVSKELQDLGTSMNETMKCWEALLPHEQH